MDMDARTKITLAWELHQGGLSNRQIARDLALNHETVGNYIRSVKTLGLLPFLEAYRSSSRKPRREPTPVGGGRFPSPSSRRSGHYGTVRAAVAVRSQVCGREDRLLPQKGGGDKNLGPQDLQFPGEKHALGNRYSRKRTKRGPIPEAAARVVQMDTVDFGKVFAFTAVGYPRSAGVIFSREAECHNLLPPFRSETDSCLLPPDPFSYALTNARR
jgi:hypothetical protein